MDTTILILLLAAGKDSDPLVERAALNLEHSEARAEIQPSGVPAEGAQASIRNQTYDLVSVPVTGGGVENLLVHRQQDIVRNTQMEGFERQELAAEVWQIVGTKKKFRFRLKERASASRIDEMSGLLVASSFGCCDRTDAHAVYSLEGGRRLFFAGGDAEPYIFRLVWVNRFRSQFVGVHVSGSDRDVDVYRRSLGPKGRRQLMVSLASHLELTDQLVISVGDEASWPPLESVEWARTEKAKGDKHDFMLWPPKGTSPSVVPRIVITTSSGDKIELPIDGDHFVIERLPRLSRVAVRRIPISK